MSSEADFEELVEPGVEDWSILRLRAASGRLCATTALKDGVQAAGLGEGAPAVAWGCVDDADYASVTGWVAVSDMDGMGGELVPGVLLAAWWGGRLWLKYAAEAPEAEAAEDEADSGAVYGGSGAMNDGMVVAREHGHGPALMVVPMTAREEFLKRDDQWRADVPWEVLAVYGAHPSGAIWGEDGSMAQERRITLWMVPVGRVVCFMATSSDRYAEDGTEAPTAARMLYSEFGRAYDKGIDALGGPHAAYWCALLPWEADGTEPWGARKSVDDDEWWTSADDDEWSEGYDPEAMCCGMVFDGLPTLKRDAFARPVSVCPRFHDSSLCGMFMAAMGWTVAPASLTELFGVEGLETWTDALEYAMVTGVLSNVSLYETAQDYRFDPDSVEGLGLSAGYTAGRWVMGAECWPPVAEPYRVTLRAKVVTTGGSMLHLVCAGSEVDGVLLTSSLFAEEPSGFEWDGSGWGGGGGGLELPEKWEPEEDEDNDDWPGPGPAPGPGEDEDVDEDPNPDNLIAVQVGYEAGAGFKSCVLTRRGGVLMWRLVLDAGYVEAALQAVEVPCSMVLRAGGSQLGTKTTVEMGLGATSAGVNGKTATGSAELVFHGTNNVDASNKAEEVAITYTLSLDVEVEEKTWYLDTVEASSAGAWVKRTSSNGTSNFQARASAWYTFSVDREALRAAAAAELKKRLAARSVNDSASSSSEDSVVSATLSGSAAKPVASAILS